MEVIDDRKGEAWSDDDTLKLIKLIQKKMSDSEIATTLQRSQGAIRSRRIKMAGDYYWNGDEYPIEMIMKFTGLSMKEVIYSIEKRKPAEFKRLLTLKRDLKNEIDPNHLNVVLYEIEYIQRKMNTTFTTTTSPPTSTSHRPPA